MTHTSVVGKDTLAPIRSFSRKRDALDYLEFVQKTHGGVWEHENHERGSHYVVHKQTAAQKKRAEEVRAAQFTLSPDCDYFSSSWGGAYRQRERVKAELDKFVADFQSDPYYALRWATSRVEHAAEYRVLSGIIGAHEAGHDIETICRCVNDEAGRLARYDSLSRSTDPMSNLAEHALRIVTHRYAGALQSHVDGLRAARGMIAAVGDGLL